MSLEPGGLLPSAVPDYVMLEGEREGEGEGEGEKRKVTRRVFVTEVNGTLTLDIYSSCYSDGPEGSLSIKRLPGKVCTLVRLQRLWASHNLLSSLPPHLSLLSHLRELFLHKNNFTEFPSVICRLSSLQILWLSSNKLAALPTDISRLTALRRLHLDHNCIYTLPDTLCDMQQLEVIYLNHNQLTRLCESIDQLSSLRRLFLQHNDILELPVGICKLTQIEKLNLDHNNIKHLTTEFQLFQTDRNADGTTRVTTRDNPFETLITRIKKQDNLNLEFPPFRSRTMSFPLPGSGRHHPILGGRGSPAPKPAKRRVLLRTTTEEEEEEEEEREWVMFGRKGETLPCMKQ